MTIKTTQTTLSNIEEERDVLNGQVRDLQDELSSLKKDNEKANEMRSLALEERSKVSLHMCLILYESGLRIIVYQINPLISSYII